MTLPPRIATRVRSESVVRLRVRIGTHRRKGASVVSSVVARVLAASRGYQPEERVACPEMARRETQDDFADA